MLKNNNQTAIKRISASSLKHNRIRNMFAVIAIILTTFMFTTVFSIGFSLGKNLNTMMLREQGTKSTIYLPNPSAEQISQIKKYDDLNAAGVQIHIASAKSIRNPDIAVSLDYYDKTEYEENYLPAISDVNGSYPDEKNEIMLSKAALEALSIKNPVENMDIALNVDGEEKTFRLSGWFTDYSFTSKGFQGFVSESYADSLGLTVEKNGVLSVSAKTGSQANLLYQMTDEVKLREGQDINSTYDVQDENVSNAAVVAVVIGFIGLIIVFSGYLLIYNVMYISVTKDIRFYGMLKTIGTAPKQIKKIVKMQAFRLSVIGIPVGILLGTLVSFVAVPYALQMFGSGRDGAMPSDINFNVFIYIGTIIFGIFTVAVSCRKPAKLASKVSPVEALKFNGNNSNKIRPYKSTSGGKLHKMAFRNVFREKKRALLVFASLFMGSMAFLATNTFIGSMKLENYLDNYLPNDYTIYFETGSEEDNPNGINTNTNSAKEIYEYISKIDGVTSVSMNRTVYGLIDFDEETFKPFIENETSDESERQAMINRYLNEGNYSCPVIGVSSDMMKLYNKKASQKIDIDRFEKGEICFMGYVKSNKQSEYVKGKIITITDDSTKNSVSIEVGACPVYGDTYGINVGYFWRNAGAPECILVSQNVIDKLNDDPDINSIIADCDSEAEGNITLQIKDLVKDYSSVYQTDIKSEIAKEFTSSMSAMNILTAGISITLIMIGIINFINVMLTGVFTRRKELAVMESVGMTKKQIKKMLMFEGIYYGIITMFLILTVGNAIVYAVAKLAQMTADYAVFNYPWALMIGILAVIMTICVIVPSVVYAMLSKESVTERLHDID